MPLPRIADFDVERELGTGAMGTVYRARRGAETVALKVIRPELIGTGDFVARLRREAEVGSRVLHPNVVRTLGSGTTEVDGRTVHYLVMEYVDGKDLRALLDELGSFPEALLREVAVQLAAGLDAIHAAGVVHRDLKPENVVITLTHEVRIMDLGVARFREATSTLTQEGAFTGTLLYAAPEAFASLEVGPASDLYALGVVLYELATGVNPFVQSSSLGVMRAQIDLVPATLRERDATVSPFLSEVVSTLMAKKPDARFPSAADLHRTLAEAEGSTWWQHRAPIVARAERHLPSIPVDRATAVYGREAELEALRTAWAAAERGEGGVVRIEGEAGIGKTRLLDELVRTLGAGRRHVLYGAFGPEGGLGGLTEAVVGLFGAADLEHQLLRHVDAQAGMVPALAARLRDQVPPPGVPPLPAEALPTLALRVLESLAEDAPVLWLVEDVHLAHEEAVKLLMALARAASRRRVLFVVTTHDPGMSDGAQALETLPGLRRLPLHRLTDPDVVHLLAEALRSQVLADSIGGRIAARSDGVPLVVLETLRAFTEHGILKRADDGSYVQALRVTTFSVPSSLRGLVVLRLKGLSEEDREILDVASVQGATFQAGTVARVLDLKPVQVLRRLAVVERRTGMVRATGSQFRFDQRQLQEVLYAELPTELRAEYHALVAEAHEAEKGPDLEGQDAYLVAFHHVRGARPRAALPWLSPALTFLERASLSDEFIAVVEAALARPGLLEGKARGEVCLRFAERLLPSAGIREARPALRDAVALAEASGDAVLRARTAYFDGQLHAMAGDAPAARAAWDRARELGIEAGDGELEARATGSIGVLLDNTGHHEEGLPMIRHQLDHARRTGNRRAEMVAACNLGLLFRHLDRADEARRMMTLHHEIAVELRDLRAEAFAYGNLALLAADAGDLEGACAQHERNIELARRAGLRGSEAIACLNLAHESVGLGRLDRAFALLSQSLALVRELGDTRSEASAEGNLGSIWAKVGRWEEALPHYERAVALHRSAQDLRHTAGSLLERSHVLAAMGRWPEARSSMQEALALVRPLGLPAVEADALLHLARLSMRDGDRATADRLSREADALVAGKDVLLVRAGIALLRAALPEGDPVAAERAVTEALPRASLAMRAELLHELWQVSGSQAHLAQARKQLADWLGRLPPALREGVEDRIAVFAAIRDGVPLAP